jgi:ADP-ribose pyrophosphatase
MGGDKRDRSLHANVEALGAVPYGVSSMAESRVLERRSVLKGRVFDIGVERVALPNGVEAQLEILHHPGAAAVVPVTKKGEIILVRQYRHAAGAYLWEIPAGTLEKDEAPERCAARELEEEAGVRASELIDLGTVVPVPGYSTEQIWLFVARGLQPATQKLDRDELVTDVRATPVGEVLRWLVDGTINDAKTAVAIFRAQARGLLGAAS